MDDRETDAGAPTRSYDPGTAPTATDDTAKPGEMGTVPSRVGRYVIGDRLGAGGMSVVYAARDPDLGRNVAIKFLSPDKQDDGPVGSSRLLREAQAMAQLSHANVVAVYDVGVAEGQVFVAMELIEGMTLREWLAVEPRSWPEIWAVFEDAGRGLAAAHAKGLVHRDFKPDNVLVDEQGRAKVSDFGLAQAAAATVEERDAPLNVLGKRMTVTGAILGTPRYMAPEQHQGEPMDARGDQFAYCAALYEAIYGAHPFPGETYKELAEAVCTGRIETEPPGFDVPRQRRDLILRGLAVAPGDRHESMTQLVSALNATNRPARRLRSWMIVAGAATIVALVATTAFAVSGRDTGALAPPACTHAGSRTASVWNNTRRDAMRRAFLASKLSHALEVFDRVDHQLTIFANNWAAARTESCQATHGGLQTAAVQDTRNSCLDSVLARGNALIDNLLEHVDAETLRRAVGATMKLNDPYLGLPRCSNAERLIGRVPPPTDETARRTYNELRDKVAEGLALMSLGRVKRAKTLADDVFRRAKELGNPDTLTTVYGLLVNLQKGNDAEIDRMVRAGIQQAALAKRDFTAAMMRIKLLDTASNLDAREARELRNLTRAAVKRAGSPPWLVAQFHVALAHSHLTRREKKQARAAAAKAVEVAESSRNPNTLIFAYGTQALIMLQTGDLRAAKPLLAKAIALINRHYGGFHHSLATLLNNLGVAAFRTGDLAGAERAFSRSIALKTRDGGGDTIRTARSLLNVGAIQLHQRKLADADKTYTRALAIFDKRHPPTHPDIAFAARNLAIVKFGRGDFTGAEALFKRAVAIQLKTLGENHPDLAVTRANYAEMLRQAKRCKAALALLRRAMPVLAKHKSKRNAHEQAALTRANCK